jgi:hypothetical protein
MTPRRRPTAEESGSRWLANRARLDAHIEAIVAAGASSLTPEQAQRLRKALRPVLCPELEQQP